MTRLHTINHHRTRRFGDHYFLSTDHGTWSYLHVEEYARFLQGQEQALEKEFTEKGIIVTEENRKQIEDAYRKKYGRLFRGTALHIVAITDRCNYKCRYCHSAVKSYTAEGYDLTEKIAMQTLKFIFQSPSPYITIEFQGGEPLINFNIIKFMVLEAKKMNRTEKRDLKFCMVSNLSLLDQEKLDFLMEHKVSICTSFDGPKNVHDANRIFEAGAKGTYDKTLEKIKFIHDNNYPVDALTTVTRTTLDYPREVVDEFRKIGIDRLMIKFINNLGFARGSWKKLSYDADEYLTFWREAIDYLVELNKHGEKIYDAFTTYFIANLLCTVPPDYTELESPCGAATSQIAYDPYGNVFSCDEGRQYDLFKIGTVDQTYRTVMHAEKTCNIIAASVNDNLLCDACAYKPFCGICVVCNYEESNNLIPKLPASTRCGIHMGIYDYLIKKMHEDPEAKKIFQRWADKFT